MSTPPPVGQQKNHRFVEAFPQALGVVPRRSACHRSSRGRRADQGPCELDPPTTSRCVGSTRKYADVGQPQC
jgi:hypothetical protein